MDNPRPVMNLSDLQGSVYSGLNWLLDGDTIGFGTKRVEAYAELVAEFPELAGVEGVMAHVEAFFEGEEEDE